MHRQTKDALAERPKEAQSPLGGNLWTDMVASE